MRGSFLGKVSHRTIAGDVVPRKAPVDSQPPSHTHSHPSLCHCFVCALLISSLLYLNPTAGPKIVAQSPPGSIAPSKTPTSRAPFVDFDVLQEYIIPRQAFCNRYLTINSPDNKYTLLGFPIVIPDSKYQRNEFIFNFGLLIEAGVDPTPYEGVVRYLAATFSAMEKQGEYLSLGERIDLRSRMAERRPIESLLEIVKEDLNNYGECMIPVGRFYFLPFHFPRHQSRHPAF